jgi:hypothetical protein
LEGEPGVCVRWWFVDRAGPMKVAVRVAIVTTAVTTAAIMQGGFVACMLNFDQFAPRGESTDSGLGPIANDGSGSCVPASCLSQAQSCGAPCAATHTQCSINCGAGTVCQRSCDRIDQICVTQCLSVCTACAMNASGCDAGSDCLDAAAPGG